MKALTVKNPYAWLIASGIKDVENRSWKTNFRGRIYIHSAATHLSHKDTSLHFTTNQWMSLDPEIQNNCLLELFPKSSIIGEVDIVDCIKESGKVWGLENNFHWILENAELYNEPIKNIKGKLSFWEFEKN